MQVKKYLIGKRYTGEKKASVDTLKQNIPLGKVYPTDEKRTSEKIADQNQVSEKTVRNSESFSESIDQIADLSGKTAMDILTTTKVTQEDAKKIVTLDPIVQKEIVEKVTTGEVKSFKEALKPIINEEVINQEPQEEHIDTDYCMYTPFIPTKSEIYLCPCGCGYGFCKFNKKWYTPEQINELDEE